MEETKKIHYIKAPCHQSSRDQGYQFAPDEIKEKYDYEIDKNLFNNSILDFTNQRIELCKGFEVLYNYILKYSKKTPNDIIVTIGGDHSISSGTIAGINEKFMKTRGNIVESDLMVLWLDCFPDIFDFNTSVTKDLNEMPVASLLGFTDNAFTSQKLLMKPEQFIFYGLLDENDNLELIKELHIPYFSVNKINKTNDDLIINGIKRIIGDKPLHISLDMKVFDSSIVPCVIPPNNKGLSYEKVLKLITSLKKNIVSMDIVEFNPLKGNKLQVKNTRELIRNILIKTFEIKTKSINIFTEQSEFLIFRPFDQFDGETDNDIGWYILRGICIKQKEELLKLVGNDNITTIDLEDEDDGLTTYLVTKTTMEEQNKKTYFTALTINDITLFPEEKKLMGFELIN